MTRLFLKKFDIFFQSNSYELLRTSKEKREKQKKWQLSRIDMDWNDKSECIMIFPTKIS